MKGRRRRIIRLWQTYNAFPWSPASLAKTSTSNMPFNNQIISRTAPPLRKRQSPSRRHSKDEDNLPATRTHLLALYPVYSIPRISLSVQIVSSKHSLTHLLFLILGRNAATCGERLCQTVTLTFHAPIGARLQHLDGATGLPSFDRVFGFRHRPWSREGDRGEQKGEDVEELHLYRSQRAVIGLGGFFFPSSRSG